MGAGTFLGGCFIAREAESDPFEVFLSDPGMIKVPLYVQKHRDMYKYLNDECGDKFTYCGDMISGAGLVRVLKFFVAKMDEGQKYSGSQLLKDKALESIQGEDITDYAKKCKDVLCMDVLVFFLDYLARYLFDMGLSFLPYGGIYLTSPVFIAMDFILVQNENQDEDFKKMKEDFLN